MASASGGVLASPAPSPPPPAPLLLPLSLPLPPPAPPLPPPLPSGASAGLPSHSPVDLFSSHPSASSVFVAPPPPQLPSSSLVVRISPTAAVAGPADRDRRQSEGKDKRKRQTREGRTSLSTTKCKVPGVKQANAPLLPSGGGADFSPDPPARFSLVAPPPQVTTAATAAPADQDQRHSEMKDNRKQQTKEGRASLSMAKRKVSGVKKANAPPEVPTAAAATPADQDQRHGDSSTPAESKRKQQIKGGRTSLSMAKRKDPAVKQANAPPSKRLKSPVVTMSPLVPARSTGIKMLLSANLRSPTVTMSPQGTASSKSQSPISPFLKKRSNHGEGK